MVRIVAQIRAKNERLRELYPNAFARRPLRGRSVRQERGTTPPYVSRELSRTGSGSLTLPLTPRNLRLHERGHTGNPSSRTARMRGVGMRTLPTPIASPRKFTYFGARTYIKSKAERVSTGHFRSTVSGDSRTPPLRGSRFRHSGSREFGASARTHTALMRHFGGRGLGRFTPRVSSYRSHPTATVRSGLPNLGNTCFANALLNSFVLYCPDMERLLQSRERDPETLLASANTALLGLNEEIQKAKAERDQAVIDGHMKTIKQIYHLISLCKGLTEDGIAIKSALKDIITEMANPPYILSQIRGHISLVMNKGPALMLLLEGPAKEAQKVISATSTLSKEMRKDSPNKEIVRGCIHIITHSPCLLGRLAGGTIFGGQQGAHELLMAILEIVGADHDRSFGLVQASFSEPTEDAIDPTTRVTVSALERRRLRNLRGSDGCSTPPDDILGGKQYSATLEIRGRGEGPVQNLVGSYIKRETMDGANKVEFDGKQCKATTKRFFTCQNPGALRTTPLEFKKHLGTTLVVRLPRDGAKKDISGIDDNLRMPIRDHSGVLIGFATYRPQAVACHSGSSGFSSGGHYTAYVREQRGPKAGHWTHVNDSTVNASGGPVEHLPDGVKKGAYLIRYSLEGFTSASAQEIRDARLSTIPEVE